MFDAGGPLVARSEHEPLRGGGVWSTESGNADQANYTQVSLVHPGTAKWIVCFPGPLLLVARRTASLRTGGSGHRRHPTPPGGLGWPEKGPCAAGQRGKARGQEPERATTDTPTSPAARPPKDRPPPHHNHRAHRAPVQCAVPDSRGGAHGRNSQLLSPGPGTLSGRHLPTGVGMCRHASRRNPCVVHSYEAVPWTRLCDSLHGFGP